MSYMMSLPEPTVKSEDSQYQMTQMSDIVRGVVGQELQRKEITGLLCRDEQPIAQVLERAARWEEDIQALAGSQGDWKGLKEGLPVFEAAAAARECPLMSDPLLLPVKAQCEKFEASFLESMAKSNDMAKDALLAPVTKFISKYGKVREAAEVWQMAEVSWVFESKSEAEVHADVDALQRSHELLKEACQHMTSIGEHQQQSCNMKMEVLAKEVGAQVALLQEESRNAFVVAASIADSQLVMDGSSLDVEEEFYNVCSTKYEVSKDALPKAPGPRFG